MTIRDKHPWTDVDGRAKDGARRKLKTPPQCYPSQHECVENDQEGPERRFSINVVTPSALTLAFGIMGRVKNSCQGVCVCECAVCVQVVCIFYIWLHWSWLANGRVPRVQYSKYSVTLSMFSITTLALN